MNINICKNCNFGELRIIYGNKKNPSHITCRCLNHKNFLSAFHINLTSKLYDYFMKNAKINTFENDYLKINTLIFNKKIDNPPTQLKNIIIDNCCPYKAEHQMSDWNEK